MEDLKGKTIRGGFARMVAQGANFGMRLGTLMILARQLDPGDFGFVGMVTAITGVLSLFRDFGLSSAAIQRTVITEAQASALFWINIVVGVLLALLTLALAPAIAAFYHEPQLVAVTAVLSIAFLFNAAGVQHGARLQRELEVRRPRGDRDTSARSRQLVAIAAAAAGLGYWALVVMTVAIPAVTSAGAWVTARWVPGFPRRSEGLASMIRFGGAMTMNSLVMYTSNNLDKVLVGRFCGVDALGLYGRAYQVASIPIDNLNSAASEVAFSALSRIRDDVERMKRYFLKGYSLLLAITIPIAVACVLCADDIVLVLLGPKWTDATPIFRWLAPTILAFAMVNPMGWFIYSSGNAARGLKMGLVIAPVTIVAYAIGLSDGPLGVARAYTIVTMLWILPAIAWAVHGTGMSFREVLSAASGPLAAGAGAAVLGFLAGMACETMSPLARLTIQCAVLFGAYAILLLSAARQRALYMDVLRGVRP